MVPQNRREDEDQTPRHERAHTVKLVISQSILSAITAAATSIGVNRAQSDSGAEERLRRSILNEVAANYVLQSVDNTRWSYYASNVNDKLGAIQLQLGELTRSVQELQRTSAKFDLLEQRGK